ncbi:MAG: hypothetical protein QOG91_550 [Candidatus Parcubacteria bacterium]|jgi:hypothetical protein|nr:hypothetical protein [Candidatus Parcubacteria bacterium]
MRTNLMEIASEGGNGKGKDDGNASRFLIAIAIAAVLVSVVSYTIGQMRWQKAVAEMMNSMVSRIDQKSAKAYSEQHLGVDWIVIIRPNAIGSSSAADPIGIIVFYPANLVLIESCRWVIDGPRIDWDVSKDTACYVTASSYIQGERHEESFRLRPIEKPTSINFVSVDPRYFGLLKERLTSTEDRQRMKE